jgi:Flp pilus assembly protein TadB
LIAVSLGLYSTHALLLAQKKEAERQKREKAEAEKRLKEKQQADVTAAREKVRERQRREEQLGKSMNKPSSSFAAAGPSAPAPPSSSVPPAAGRTWPRTSFLYPFSLAAAAACHSYFLI